MTVWKNLMCMPLRISFNSIAIVSATSVFKTINAKL